jgi:hypothetical protein
MSERSVVWWEDISSDAEPMFRVWTEGRELQWAKECWEALAKRGLTSYSDELERTVVLVRLLTLAGIYLDFCELAFDEIHDAGYTMWAHNLGLTTLRIVQCVDPQLSENELADDDELLEDAINNLMGKARSDIREVLRSRFGDDALLFVSLWNTVEYDRSESDTTVTGDSRDAESENDEQRNDRIEEGRIDWREGADCILNGEITGRTLAAFAWIEQGMTSLH